MLGNSSTFLFSNTTAHGPAWRGIYHNHVNSLFERSLMGKFEILFSPSIISLQSICAPGSQSKP